MELRITTKRALEFEERTGKDIVQLLKQMKDTNSFTVRDIVDLFIACGEGYTVEMFDLWDLPLADKVTAIMKAVEVFFAGKK